MAKFWEFIKKWFWAIILGVASIFALGRKPMWVRQKETEIKNRDKDIAEQKKNVSGLDTGYKEVKEKHDQTIQEAEKMEGSPLITDPDSAASFIDDILGKRK